MGYFLQYCFLSLLTLYLLPYFFDFHVNFVLMQRLLIVTNIQEITHYKQNCAETVAL